MLQEVRFNLLAVIAAVVALAIWGFLAYRTLLEGNPNSEQRKTETEGGFFFGLSAFWLGQYMSQRLYVIDSDSMILFKIDPEINYSLAGWTHWALFPKLALIGTALGIVACAVYHLYIIKKPVGWIRSWCWILWSYLAGRGVTWLFVLCDAHRHSALLTLLKLLLFAVHLLTYIGWLASFYSLLLSGLGLMDVYYAYHEKVDAILDHLTEGGEAEPGDDQAAFPKFIYGKDGEMYRLINEGGDNANYVGENSGREVNIRSSDVHNGYTDDFYIEK